MLGVEKTVSNHDMEVNGNFKIDVAIMISINASHKII